MEESLLMFLMDE